MESLPEPILESICAYLAYGERHKQSLLAFASVSWACRAAALRECYSRVSIDMDYGDYGDDEMQYQRGLERLEDVLDAAECRNCVRVLEIGMGPALRSEEAGGEVGNPVVRDLEFRPRKPKPCPQPDEWWQPLARFLSSLFLKKLIWTPAEPVPFCILSVLRERMPRCRLHIHEFNLQSLHQRKPLKDIDETEYLMTISLSLYRIIAPYSMHDASGRPNYNEEAVLRFVAGLAPNLKHVSMWANRPFASGEISSLVRRERSEWRGLQLQSNSDECEPPIAKGQLLSLEITELSTVCASQLASWEACTNFAVLTSLKLSCWVDTGVLRLLADIAERHGLDALKVLALPTVDCEDEDRDTAYCTKTRLLLSLPPLEELCLDGVVNASFEAVLTQHGTTLRILRMANFFLSPRQVAQLRETCLHIRELSIEILRSAGDAIEVETYRVVGSMRCLESLELVLQCTDYHCGEEPDSPHLQMEPSDDEQVREATARMIRQVFVNAALDEDLARSIFQTIWIAHTSVKAGLPPRLNNMHLQVSTARNSQVIDSCFEGLVALIGQSWLCRCDARNTHQGELYVEQPGTRSYTDYMEEDMDEFPPNADQYTAIWQSLWPKTEAGWRKDWRSFPLAYGADEPTGTATVLSG